MTNPNDSIYQVESRFDHSISSGLTKREYFAAMAMQGLLSNPEHANRPYNEIVDGAAGFADALIAELNRPEAS